MKAGKQFYPPHLRISKEFRSKFGIPADILQKRAEYRLQLHESRKVRMIRMVASGMTTSEMAKVFDVTESTMETYRLRLVNEMGATNSCQMLKIAYDRGLLKPGEHYEDGWLKLPKAS